MAERTPEQRRLHDLFDAPFFQWQHDDALKNWLASEVHPEDLEAYLDIADFARRPEREGLGRNALRLLMARHLPPQPEKEDRRVFVVHGRNLRALKTVETSLVELYFEPVILNRHANMGRGLLEKVIQMSEGVPYAVIVVTPDDFGGLVGDPARPRARQNVILELGYFIGKLTTAKVCILRQGRDLELPSDLHSVADIEMDDAGGWRTQLALELKGAGFSVDARFLSPDALGSGQS